MDDFKNKVLIAVKNGEITADEAFKIIKNAQEKKEDLRDYQLAKIEKTIIESVASILKYKIEMISSEKDIREFGFNSFTLAKFKNDLEKKLNIQLDSTAFFNNSTISSISSYIYIYYFEKNSNKISKKSNNIITKMDKLNEKRKSEKKVVGKYILDYESCCILNNSLTIPKEHIDEFWANTRKHNEKREIKVSNVSSEILNMLNEYGAKFQHLLIKISTGENIEVVSAGQGKPLVIIAGIGATAKLSYNQIEKFYNKRRIIVIHVPGTGLSEGIEDLSLNNIAKIVIEILGQLKVKEQFSVMGCSWGALIALTLAKNYVDEIEKVVLVSPIVDLKSPNENESAEEHLVTINEEVYEDFQSIKDGEEFYLEYLKSISVDSIAVANYMKYFNEDFEEYYSVKNILEDIDKDVLIINGTNDVLCEKRHSEILREKLKNNICKDIEGAGHFSPLTHSDEVNKLIDNFLNISQI